MKSGEYPWCIIDVTNDKQKLICDKCKQEHNLNMINMSIEEFVRLSEAFCELHKNCKVKVAFK